MAISPRDDPWSANDARQEARCLVKVLRAGTMSAEEIAALIAVSENDRRVLDEIAAGSPAAKPKIERMIDYRREVGQQFERLVAKGKVGLFSKAKAASL